MASFVWGGNTGQMASPEQIERQNALSQALMRRGSVATNPWEGLAQVASSVSGALLGKRADQASQQQRQAATEQFNTMLQGDPGLQDLAGFMGNEFANEGQRAVAEALMNRAVEPQDPWANTKVINDQLVTMGPDGQPQVMGDFGEADTSAAEDRITRLTENLQATGDFVDPQEARNIATGIVDGRLTADRDPVTRDLQIVDMATGQVVYGGSQQQGGAGQPQPAPDQAQADGQDDSRFPAARESFGLGGATQGLINRGSDIIFGEPAFPDVQETQANFRLLRENLLNDIAGAYNRQPPSWLLREIRELTPAAGSVTEGASGAQSKLRAIRSQFQSELETARQSLNSRELSPKNRQELEAQITGLESALARVQEAENAFGGGEQETEGGGADLEGLTFQGQPVTEEDIEFNMDKYGMSREEVIRALRNASN